MTGVDSVLQRFKDRVACAQLYRMMYVRRAGISVGPG